MKIKSPVYPTVIAACVLGLVGLLLVWLRFSISIEPTPPEASLPMPTRPSATAEQSPTVPDVSPPAPTSTPDPADLAARQGALRMSNQTEQPVRVALLARHTSAHSVGQSAYDRPAHWDFAPGEGSQQGLLLSLPEGNFKLKPGDILVAFAQDGSRRYWGPYVVGETVSPTWERQKGEWQLTLK